MTLVHATFQNAAGEMRAMAGPYRVVVVEARDVAISLRRLLEVLGHQVETASEGRRGIELVMAARPDVVFTRIELPDMDGYQVAREIRSECGERPVLVAHTGYGRWQIGREAKEAGFDLLVTKPVSVEQLRGVLSFVAGERDCGEILL